MRSIHISIIAGLMAVVFLCGGLPVSAQAASEDWYKPIIEKNLKDMSFIEYVKSLNLSGKDSLTFWKKSAHQHGK